MCDGLGMSVGEAVEERYFSPTNDSPAAGSGASGSPAAGGALQGARAQLGRGLPAAAGAGLACIANAQPEI